MTRRRNRIAAASVSAMTSPEQRRSRREQQAARIEGRTIPAALLELDDTDNPNREQLHVAAADAANAIAQLLDDLRTYDLDAPQLSRREREQLERAAALIDRIEDRIEADRAAHGDESDRFGNIAENIAERREREQAAS